MKIDLNTILTLAGYEGRDTLQIPQYDVIFKKSVISLVDTPATENYPDDYFMILGGKTNLPVVGKEQGYLYLTRKGYYHFRPQIAEARKNSIRNTDIESLNNYATTFYAELQQRVYKRTRTLEIHHAILKEFTGFL